MKKIILSLLVASAVMASDPASAKSDMDAMANQMFMKMKENTLDMSKQMLVTMKEAKKCFIDAKGKEDAKKCANTMSKKSEEVENKMASAFGIDKAKIKEEKKRQETEFDKMEWNEKEKTKTIAELDKAITQGTISTKCMDESKGFKDFRECMTKNGLMKK